MKGFLRTWLSCHSDHMSHGQFACAGSHTQPYLIFLLSVFLVVSWFLLTGNVGLDLMDEGYLWYDTHQTVHGAVPIRDFRSYDPGRYYWGAFWTTIFGEGIQALRISTAIVQLFGIFLGLLIARRVIGSNRGLVIVGILLLLWMWPRNKLFEHTLAISAVFFAVRLIEVPRPGRYFQAGAIVGLAAFFGKNLGLYFVAGFFCLILFLEFRSDPRKIASRYGIWLAGVVVGYTPMILMLLFVPNFASSFSDSLARLMGPLAPVKSLPIPFPWRLSLSEMVSSDGVRTLVLGCAFLLALTFYMIGVLKIFSLRSRLPSSASVLTASVFLGIPLLFHFLSRADFNHFAESSAPLLLGLMGFRGFLAVSKKRWSPTLATGALASLAIVAVTYSPEISLTGQKVSQMMLGKREMVKYQILQDTLWIPGYQAKYLEYVKQLLADRVGPNQKILIAPYEPGLYRILQTESPIWDPFPIHVASNEEEERAIRNLESKNVQWALIWNKPLDGKPDRRFSRTHARMWEYLNEHFVSLYVPWMSEVRIVMRRSVSETIPTSPQPSEDVSFSEKLAELASRRGYHDDAAWNELLSIYQDRQKMKWIRQNAEQGNPVTQFHMGMAYQKGSGVPNDHEEAVKWYRMAADQDYAVAQTSLGFMYVMGWGVSKDYKEAVKWYRKAADQDYAVAQTSLGLMYEKGSGVPRDYEEAAKWYGKASEQGYYPAKQALLKLSETRKHEASEP